MHVSDSILNIKEEVETKGESVDRERKGSNKGRAEKGLGQNMRGDNIQVQKKIQTEIETKEERGKQEYIKLVKKDERE